MANRRIPKKLREQLLRAAGHRCGYCMTSELVSGATLEFDHLLPHAKGGFTVKENLWPACRDCNSAKAVRVSARDPLTKKIVRLFQPGRDQWPDHFLWTDDGVRIEGTTPSGRATVEALQLNRKALLLARRVWIEGGVHPPLAEQP